MAGEVSIWRWAVTDDLDARFLALVQASDDEFSKIAAQIMQDGEGQMPVPSIDEIEAETEAKMRGMNLPQDILDSVLKGLKTMMGEAREDQAADLEADEDDFAPDPDGRVGIALASSHMFYDDPYASIEYEEIDRQVAALMNDYRAAISKALGHAGQSMAAFLGVRQERLYEDVTFDVLMAQGLAEVDWLWVSEGVVHFLSQWHEDKELPIDLEFNRAPLAIFEAAKAQI